MGWAWTQAPWSCNSRWPRGLGQGGSSLEWNTRGNHLSPHGGGGAESNPRSLSRTRALQHPLPGLNPFPGLFGPTCPCFWEYICPNVFPRPGKTPRGSGPASSGQFLAGALLGRRACGYPSCRGRLAHHPFQDPLSSGMPSPTILVRGVRLTRTQNSARNFKGTFLKIAITTLFPINCLQTLASALSKGMGGLFA